MDIGRGGYAPLPPPLRTHYGVDPEVHRFFVTHVVNISLLRMLIGHLKILLSFKEITLVSRQGSNQYSGASEVIKIIIIIVIPLS